MQIKGIYKVGAGEDVALCEKKCRKYDESYIMKNFITWSLHKYFWDDKIRRVTWAGHVVCMEDMITEYEILFRKAEGKKLLGRHKVC